MNPVVHDSALQHVDRATCCIFVGPRDDGRRLAHPQEDRLVQGVRRCCYPDHCLCLSRRCCIRRRRGRDRARARAAAARPARRRYGARAASPLHASSASAARARARADAASGSPGSSLRMNPRRSLERVTRLLAAGCAASRRGLPRGEGLSRGGRRPVRPGRLGRERSADRACAARRLCRRGRLHAPGVPRRIAGAPRRDTVAVELPDALDLLAVSVEAGMGFDGAISKLTEHMDGAADRRVRARARRDARSASRARTR